jgi:hypothetical protein
MDGRAARPYPGKLTHYPKIHAQPGFGGSP